MAFFSAMAKLNMVQSFEDAFGAPDITSSEMQKAIASWFNLYFDSSMPCEVDSSQRIPYVIVDGLHKAVFGEYECSVDAKEDKGERLKASLDELDDCRQDAFQQTLIGGEGFIKPIPYKGNFIFSFVNRQAFIVLGRDAKGNITSAGTSEVTVKAKTFYTLLERRTVADDGSVTIENKLFKSDAPGVIGSPVALTSVPEYAHLEPEAKLSLPLDNLGLIPIKTPMSNCVDGSKDGVSVYAAAVNEIMNAYGHAKRTDNEYELTEPHALVSEDLQRRDTVGNLVPIAKYITPIDGSPDEVGYNVYNPKPNQQELEARENQLLRHIEDICGLRRGTISHVDTEDKTATEVLTSSGRYALTIKDFQKMWEKAVFETVRTCNILGRIYHGWDKSELPEVEIGWGNGVLYDEQKDYERLRDLVADGHLKPEYLIKWMEIKAMDPQEIASVREQFMPELADVE